MYAADSEVNNIDMPSYGGVVAHSYSPSNWLLALGLFSYTQYATKQNIKNLFNPAKHYTYLEPKNIKDIYVVSIIGETTRWDHMGILDCECNTTTLLKKEKFIYISVYCMRHINHVVTSLYVCP